MRFACLFEPLLPITHLHGSVLNTFKSMVVDDDVLEKEDMFILERMRGFISNEEVIRFAAAKQMMVLIERAVSNSPRMAIRLY